MARGNARHTAGFPVPGYPGSAGVRLVCWQPSCAGGLACWRRSGAGRGSCRSLFAATIRLMHAWLDLDNRKNLMVATDLGVQLLVQDYGLRARQADQCFGRDVRRHHQHD